MVDNHLEQVSQKLKGEIRCFYLKQSYDEKKCIIRNIFNIIPDYRSHNLKVNSGSTILVIAELWCKTIFDNHFFAKQTFMEEDILFLIYIFSGREMVVYEICERALIQNRIEFVDLVFKIPKLRSFIKTKDVIMLNKFNLLKRIYLEGFEWMKIVMKGIPNFKKTEYLSAEEHKSIDNITNFLEDYIDLWKNGLNHANIKPAKRDNFKSYPDSS